MDSVLLFLFAALLSVTNQIQATNLVCYCNTLTAYLSSSKTTIRFSNPSNLIFIRQLFKTLYYWLFYTFNGHISVRIFNFLSHAQIMEARHLNYQVLILHYAPITFTRTPYSIVPRIKSKVTIQPSISIVPLTGTSISPNSNQKIRKPNFCWRQAAKQTRMTTVQSIPNQCQVLQTFKYLSTQLLPSSNNTTSTAFLSIGSTLIQPTISTVIQL